MWAVDRKGTVGRKGNPVKRLALVTFVLGAALAIVPIASASVLLDGSISKSKPVVVSGKPAGMTQAEYQALMARSAALDARYGLNGITLRPDILDDSRPTVTPASTGGSSFDWNTTIGATLGAMLLLAAAATVVTRRRHQLSF